MCFVGTGNSNLLHKCKICLYRLMYLCSLQAIAIYFTTILALKLLFGVCYCPESQNISIESESFKKLRWATIGHLYDWGNRKYNGYAEFPVLLKGITEHINSHLSELYSKFTADVSHPS
ncbi:uncharacterized protein BEWA_034460 [Theileria equi strain WA]|uniref:Membrane protein, putative n=1 Tax=Theileria equi strain WA TaxID=1537102 RepID=L0AZA1_THEEQ|nr:uncharacterized protein BEWA_034460 [Theileria equi strain WA]AFZ80588.1 membrane protein, putative [Theileria equi strain WA]|eukprot:XP_004830254.1 uncharacterized protein BEWA_034460 [Theileria equi strain WA]